MSVRIHSLSCHSFQCDTLNLPLPPGIATETYANGVGSSTLSSASSYADGVGSSAVNTANSYADGVGSACNSYADGVGSSAVSTANSYADGVGSSAVSTANSYADGVGSSAVSTANSYADGVGSACNSYADGVGSSTLTSAKSYTDNIALRSIAWQKQVISIHDFAVVPVSQNGDRYISETTTGAFTANYIYEWNSGTSTWDETVPTEGWTVYVLSGSISPDQSVTFTGTGMWVNTGISIDHTDLINRGTLTHSTIDGYLDQAVKTSSSPTFAGITSKATTANQLSVQYDVSNKADFDVSSAGLLTIAPSGTAATVTKNLAVLGAYDGAFSTIAKSSMTTVANNGTRWVSLYTNSAYYSDDDFATWTYAPGTDGTYYGACYVASLGKYIAVGTGTHKAIYSSDGTSWSYGSWSDSGTLSSVCYGNGVIVAVYSIPGTYACATSTDGINWTGGALRNNVGGVYYSVVFTGTQFMTIDATNNIAFKSANGATWTTAGTIGASPKSRSLTCVGGLLVSVGYPCQISGGQLSCVFTSPDYAGSWQPRTAAANENWGASAYGNGYYCAVSTSTGHVMASADGISWNFLTTTDPLNDWISCVYGNNRFVFSGGATSALGTWLAASFPSMTATKSRVAVTAITNSSSPSTGAFTVAGGAGFAKPIYCRGIVDVSDSANQLSVQYDPTHKLDCDISSAGGATLTPTTTLTVAKPLIAQTTTANQMSIGYDVSNKADFDVSSAGLLTVTPSGASLTVGKPLIVKYATTPQLSVRYDDTNKADFAVAPFSGILTVTPSGTSMVVAKQLIAKSTTANQLSVRYSDTYKTDFDTSSAGDLTITPSDGTINGRTVTVAGQLAVSSMVNTTRTYLWTMKTLNPLMTWNSICHGDNLFVIVASGLYFLSNVTTSRDGVTWSGGATPTGEYLSVCYGAGTYLAVGPTGCVMTSTDGLSWSAQTADHSATWQSVCYGLSKFVAVASDGTSNRVMYSSNLGVTWTGATFGEDNAWRSICYGSGKFVSVSYDGTHRAAWSTDGISWNLVSVPAGAWTSVTYGNGLFVAVGTTAGTYHIMTSPDGLVWTSRTPGHSLQAYTSVAYGNGLYVACCAFSGKEIALSTDGITWTVYPTLVNANWNGICYADGKFFVVSPENLGTMPVLQGTSLLNSTCNCGDAVKADTMTVYRNSTLGGQVTVNDTTASASSTTGAVVVAGGMGLGGGLNCGGIVDKSTTANQLSVRYDDTHKTDFDVSNAGDLTVTPSGASMTMAKPLIEKSTTANQLSVRYDDTHKLDIDVSVAGAVSLTPTTTLTIPANVYISTPSTLYINSIAQYTVTSLSCNMTGPETKAVTVNFIKVGGYCVFAQMNTVSGTSGSTSVFTFASAFPGGYYNANTGLQLYYANGLKAGTHVGCFLYVDTSGTATIGQGKDNGSWTSGQTYELSLNVSYMSS